MRDSIGEAVKRMPFSIQAEQSLLGSLLINPSALTDIVDKVRDADFYLKDHAGIYAAILEISRRNGDVDVVTLLDVIDREGLFDSREAAENYLRRLTEVVPSALNIGDYAGIVLEKSLLRRLIEYGDDLSRKAYSETESSDSLLAYAEGELSKLAQGRDTRRFQELSKLISYLYDRLAALAQLEEQVVLLDYRAERGAWEPLAVTAHRLRAVDAGEHRRLPRRGLRKPLDAEARVDRD